MNNESAKALKKSHRSVKEMLEDIGADRDVVDAVEDVRRQGVTNTLAGIRISKGLTQKEMAVLLKCTQGRISKLETGKDDDLRLKDLADYARAASVSLSVTIGPRNCAEAIKYHLFAVKHLIDKLVGLDDGRDSKLTDGIRAFLDKLLWYTAELVGSSKRALKKADDRQGQPPKIEIISGSYSLIGSDPWTRQTASTEKQGTLTHSPRHHDAGGAADTRAKSKGFVNAEKPEAHLV